MVFEHNISQCVASCGENFTVYDTNECVSKCPPGYYESTINKKCYNICNIDPDYPFSTEDDSGKLICDKKCNDKAAHYDSNLICSNTCSSLTQNITDYDIVTDVYYYSARKPESNHSRYWYYNENKEVTIWTA